MDLQAQLQQEVAAHNELHANIQAGEQQLEGMKADLARRLGRVQLLQEMLQDAADEPDGTAENASDPGQDSEV